MRKWCQRVVKSKKFFVVAAALMVAMQPMYGVFTAPTAGAASQVVTGDSSTWLFNRDEDTRTPYHFTTAKAKTGYGSLYVEPIGAANPKDKFIAEYVNKTPVDELQSIGYDFKIAGNGTPASANHFYLNVYANIDDSDNYFDCRFDYTPTASSLGFTKAEFATTDTPSHVQQSGSARTTCPATLAEMPASSHMRAFAINVGDTSANDAGLAGYLDNVVVKKTAGVETYDLERELPTVQYVLPSISRNEFRSGANPLRVKVSDAQEVTRVAFSIWKYDPVTDTMVSHVKNMGVNRNQCNLNNAGKRIVCDVKDSGAWQPLAPGTYKAKLTVYVEGEATVRANMNEYWSPSFTVDDTRPTVDNFVLESPANGITNSTITMAASASDNLSVESVNFFVTKPRESDGKCTGGGARLLAGRTTAKDVDNLYRLSFDVSSLSDGSYCVSAQARDTARNNSIRSSSLTFTVDKTAPTLVVSTPEENAVFGGDDQIVVTSYMEDVYGLGNYFIDINSAEVTILSDPDIEELPEAEMTETTSTESANLTIIAIYNAADFDDGEYVITVRVTDKAGNVTEENRTIFIDHSVPAVPGRGVGETPPTAEETDQAEDELTQLAQRLTQPFSIPRSFVSSTGGAQTNQEVLGLENGDEKEVASGEQTVAAAPSSEGWKIFGIAWYWWLLLAAVLGIATAWIMRRRNSGEA